MWLQAAITFLFIVACSTGFRSVTARIIKLQLHAVPDAGTFAGCRVHFIPGRANKDMQRPSAWEFPISDITEEHRRDASLETVVAKLFRLLSCCSHNRSLPCPQTSL